MQKRDGNFSWISRHKQLKDRLDEELALEAKAEENLKAKARLFGSRVFRCFSHDLQDLRNICHAFCAFCAFSGV